MQVEQQEKGGKYKSSRRRDDSEREPAPKERPMTFAPLIQSVSPCGGRSGNGEKCKRDPTLVEEASKLIRRRPQRDNGEPSRCPSSNKLGKEVGIRCRASSHVLVCRGR